MTREDLDFIGSMNMCDEISDEAYKKIVCHFEGQEPCGDCINRKAVMDCFKKWQPYMATRMWEFEKELKELPSVNPQEPKTEQEIREELNRLSTYRVPNSNTDLVSRKAVERVLNLVFRGCRDKEPKTNILDKIRAEIEKVVWEDVVVSFDGTDEIRIPRLDPDDVLQIIDKYKAKESEEE